MNKEETAKHRAMELEAKPPCSECGGSKEVLVPEPDVGGVCGAAFEAAGVTIPCPACADSPTPTPEKEYEVAGADRAVDMLAIAKPPVDEFVKENEEFIRDANGDFQAGRVGKKKGDCVIDYVRALRELGKALKVITSQKARIEELEGENKGFREDIKNHNYIIGQRDKLRTRIEELEAENKKLTRYKDYVEARIGTNEIPDTFEKWNAAVEELVKDLEEAVAEQKENEDGRV